MVTNRTRIRLILGALFLLSFSGACQSALQREPVSARQDLTPPPSLSVEALDRRILYLDRLLETQDLSKDDRELAQDLLVSYRSLKTASQTGSLKQNYSPAINMLLRNLEQMEDRYFTKQVGGASLSSEGVRQLAIKRKKILEAFAAGNDQAVIDGILDLEKTFGPEALTPDLSLLFALSLGKRGTFTTALSVGQDVTSQLEAKPDLLQLRAQMIEWQLALGNEKEAKEIYERLQRKLSEREALVRGLEQKFSPERSMAGLPDSAVPKEEGLKADTERDVREALAKADEWVQKGDFGRAKFVLLQQRIRVEEGPDAKVIDQALKSVEMAEEKAQQQRKPEVAAVEPAKNLREELQQEAQKQDTLKVALGLIRNEKFEEAILKLDELPPTDAEVKELKDRAVEKIINRERNKAAQLFLAASKSKDPAKKEELLTSSYNVLKAVADKYPSSPLTPKLQNHMNQVTKELAKVKKGEG
jgi:thioredoxin-like negative regulator of GroEL